jgi:3-hydroxybutyryl-CoA dehydrogenase
LSVGDLAAELPRGIEFAGLHFFNPVLKLELAEIVTYESVTPGTIRLLQDVCTRLNKTPVLVKDSPGFIVNRLMACQICQAIRMLEEGVATAEDIDLALKLGLLHPIGPLALADLIGLDVMLNILTNIFEKTGDESFRPPMLLLRLVDSGCLGRKSGSGLHPVYN